MNTINLNQAPHLNALLLNHISVVYEDNAPALITDDILEAEYHRLRAEGKLERLFEGEQLMFVAVE